MARKLLSEMLKLDIDRMLDITERVIKEKGAFGKYFEKYMNTKDI